METSTILSPETLRNDVEHLKDWLAKEPHLPTVTDDDWLATFLHHNKFSLEKTKLKLDGYFSCRNKYPDILKNRDPTAPEILNDAVAYNYSISDKLTKNGERILFIKPHPDPSLFEITAHLKRLFMICDLVYLENDRSSGFMTVANLEHLSYLHLLKGFSGIKPAIEIFINAYSQRIQAFHIFNAPVFINKVMEAFRRFFPKKLADRFVIHSSIDSLRAMVDEDVLCSDFGGKGPTLAEYDKYTRSLLEKHRKWFLEQNDVCSNEQLRRKDDDQTAELRGSFRKLDFD